MHIDGLLFKIEIRTFPQANVATDFPDSANKQRFRLVSSALQAQFLCDALRLQPRLCNTTF